MAFQADMIVNMIHKILKLIPTSLVIGQFGWGETTAHSSLKDPVISNAWCINKELALRRNVSHGYGSKNRLEVGTDQERTKRVDTKETEAELNGIFYRHALPSPAQRKKRGDCTTKLGGHIFQNWRFLVQLHV